MVWLSSGWDLDVAGISPWGCGVRTLRYGVTSGRVHWGFGFGSRVVAPNDPCSYLVNSTTLVIGSFFCGTLFGVLIAFLMYQFFLALFGF